MKKIPELLNLELVNLDKKAAHYEALWLNQYDKDVKRHLPSTEMTLNDFVLQWVKQQPDKPFIIHKDHSLSYLESNSLACKLAAALLRLGCKKGDLIVLALPNIPEILIGFMACYKIGLVVVGLNWRSTLDETRANLVDNLSETIVVTADHAEKAIQLLKEESNSLKNVLVVGGKKYASQERHIFDFYDILKKEKAIEPSVEVKADDPQVLYYTGGTTGVSKGCSHTNRSLVTHGRAFKNWFSPGLSKNETTILMCLPITHSYGMNCSLNWCLIAGGTVVLLESATIDDILHAVDKYKPTIWPAVPALINALVYHPQAKKVGISSLEIIICGAAPITLETLKTLRSLANTRIVEGFGMTECINAASFNPVVSGGKFGSVGVPISDTDVLIVDPQNGTDLLEAGQKGEIIYRGPQVISEYWNIPEESARALRGGWMYSGDIGYLDEDGFLYIVDRKKDMIITGGYNIYPSEIDNLLFQHPKIYEACTIGVPHPRLGEVLKSFVVLNKGEALLEKEIIDYCRKYLSAYKAPRSIAFMDKIPKTKVNKNDKETLRRKESVSKM